MARRSRRGGRRHRRRGPAEGAPTAAPAAAPAAARPDPSGLPTTSDTVPLTDLLKLLHHDAPEIQCATARILQALKIFNPAAREHLLFVLNHGPETVRSYVMDALQAGADEAPLESYVGLLGTSPAMTQKAAGLLARQGPAALELLTLRIRGGGGDEFRRAALQTIHRIGGVDGVRRLVELIPDLEASPELLRFAVEQAAALLPVLKEEERAALTAVVSDALRAAAKEKQGPATAALLRLLGRLRDPDSLTLLLSFIGKAQEPPILAACLGALNALGDLPEKVHENVFPKLLGVLEHEDFDNIVRPALSLLERIPADKSMAPALQKLHKSAHRSVRAFALRQLGAVGAPRSFEQMMEAMASTERKESEAARQALSSNKVYITPLAEAFRAAKTSEEAWAIGRLLQNHRADLPRTLLGSLATYTAGLIGERSPLFQATFELLRAASPALLQETVYERGKDLYERQKYVEAIEFLKHLDRHDLATGDSDLLLAMARIAIGPRDPARAARDRHPGLLLLGRLARRTDFDIAAALRKIKGGLRPEDLLFAGYYLVELTGVDRALGGEMLKYLAANYRSSEAARSASTRLKTERIR